MLFLLYMVIGACGDSETDGNGDNGAPLYISGTPPAYAVVGRSYSFKLEVFNSNTSKELSFDHNLPGWLTLNASHPTEPIITGVPAAGDIGGAVVTIKVYNGSLDNAARFDFLLKVIDAASVGSPFIGVPNPDGMVPAAIMPELPDADHQIAAFPYDPITMDSPDWNDGPNQFWVDAGGPCDDAGNAGRGSPASPRCTLPGISNRTWTLSAGSQVFVVGNGAEYGDGEVINQMNFAGTFDHLIWIIGVGAAGSPRWKNQPKLAFERLMVGDGPFTHVVMENVHIYSAGDDFRGIYSTSEYGGRIAYLTFRHLTCSGSGTDMDNGIWSGDSRRCFNFDGAGTNPIRFVVIYDSDIFGLGHWVDDMDTDVDLIGMQVQGAVYYLWYIANRSYHIQGDSIQCSNSDQWDQQMDRRPHYIYVAGNEFYENYDSAWDSKGCYHTVFSENYLHDFTNSIKAANNTAIIAADDGQSYVGGNFEWYLNNRFQDVANPFAYKGTQQDAYVYFIGNLVSNIFTGPAVQVLESCSTHDDLTTCGNGMFIGQNSFDCNQQGPAVIAAASDTAEDATVPAEEQTAEMIFWGNIFFDCLDAPNGDSEPTPHVWENISADFELIYNYNLDFRDGGSEDIILSAYNDEALGNQTNVDPLFVDPTGSLGGDYALQNDSQARAMVPESEVYSLFKKMYDLDIRLDLDGNRWHEGDMLNAGAYQN